MKVRAAREAFRVYLAPERKASTFRYEGGYVVCEVPRVMGHQAVVFE